MDDTTRLELSAVVAQYRDLLVPFVEGHLSADDFESAFQARYLSTDSAMSAPVFDVVDAFFADVDEYVSDPELRRVVPGAIGPAEMRDLAAALLRAADG